MDWLWWLLDSSPWVPRGACGDWGPWLPLVYRVSNWLIALSYFAIPLSLVHLYRRQRANLPSPWMLLCFVVFIVACGLGHVADAFAFVWPAYRLFTLVDVATALVSVATAVLLPGVVRRLADFKSPEEYERIVNELRQQATANAILLDLQQQRAAQLQSECDVLREEFEQARHKLLTEDRYQHMREVLHRVRDAGK